MTNEVKSIRLRDGRELGYSEFGDSKGIPVLYFHGSGGCSGPYAENYADAAAANGIRIIAPDRPGFGRSAMTPGRTILDWPADVAELAAQLNLTKLSIFTESGGSAYGLACATKLPNLVAKIAVISGVAPPALTRPPRGIPWRSRVMLNMMRKMPARLLAGMFKRTETGIKKDPGKLLAQLARGAGAAEREILLSPVYRRIFQTAVLNAFAQGYEGVIDDFKLVNNDWGFTLSEIKVPVLFWHGEADTSAPPLLTRRMQAAIPGSRITFYPHEGHAAVPLLHAKEILGVLKNL